MFFNKLHVAALVLCLASASTQAKGNEAPTPTIAKLCYVRLPTTKTVYVNANALNTIEYFNGSVFFYTNRTVNSVDAKGVEEANALIVQFLASVEEKCK